MNVPAPIAGSVFLLLALLVLDGPGWLRRDGERAAARLRRLALDAWAAGVLASHLFLVGALGRPDPGLEATAREMALAFLPALLGLAVAAAAGMRALARTGGDAAPGRDGGEVRAVAPVGGAAAFALLVVAGFLAATNGGGEGRLAPAVILLHPPALLAFAGAALLLLRLAGRGRARNALAPAFALAGLLAGLGGLVQALAGFAAHDLGRVTAGLAFLLTSGFAALLGLLVAGRVASVDDRAGTSAVADVLARALLPLVAIVFLAFAFVAVLTPTTAPG
jgi:hypothetical protein